jgi:hypothetical protein
VQEIRRRAQLGHSEGVEIILYKCSLCKGTKPCWDRFSCPDHPSWVPLIGEQWGARFATRPQRGESEEHTVVGVGVDSGTAGTEGLTGLWTIPLACIMMLHGAYDGWHATVSSLHTERVYRRRATQQKRPHTALSPGGTQPHAPPVRIS